METISAQDVKIISLHLKKNYHVMYELLSKFNITTLVELPKSQVTDFIIEIGLLTDKEGF